MKRLLFSLLFLSALAPQLRAAEPSTKPFLGPIPVQYVSPNEECVIDMHRFFSAPDNEIMSIGDVDGVSATYNPMSFELRLRAAHPGLFDFEILASRPGLSDAAIKASRLTTALTVACEPAPAPQHFSFKPAAATGKVFLGGSFNGWSMNKLPLKGPDDQGAYSLDLPLKPGRYAYKFAVNGKWVLDPNNPQTEDNGLGDKNSVLLVAREPGNVGPTIFADRLNKDTLFVRAAGQDDQLATVSAIYEGPDGTRRLAAKINGNEIQVPVLQARNGFVRVIAANKAGIPSNTVRVPLDDTPSQFHWQDAVLYYAFTDRFADGDKSNDHPVDNPDVQPQANYHGGDLRGITQKIEAGYFEKLGANTIWVAPLNRNPAVAYQESPEPHRWYTGYHGYWPVSSTELDPHIGKKEDLTKLVETAHAHHMKVIADLVLHHVHEEHPWWKEHRDWFGTLDLPDGRKNLRLWDEQQFTTWFEPYLPSFDFSKDAPVKALIDNSIWWANTYKLDGFRLDAVKHILPSFWWKFRAALREKVSRPGDAPLYLVGETFKDRAGIMTFVGPNMLDGQFDFPLYDQIKDTFGESNGGMQALDDGLSASEKIYGKETLMSPLVGNHDKGRFMAYADHDLPGPAGVKDEEIGWKNPPTVNEPESYKKLELAQAFLMSIDGVPMIYYGDEIGMTGAGDPDNRRDMRFGDQVTADEEKVFENFEKLGALRKNHPALRYGSRRTVACDKDLYAFVRAQLNDRIVIAFNRGKDEAKLDLDVAPEMADGTYLEVLSGNSVTVKDGKLSLTLPEQTAAFVTKK